MTIIKPSIAAPRTSQCFALIGGLGPPATVFYYQSLLRAFSDRNAVAKLVIAHTDMAHALSLVAAGDKRGLAQYLASFIRSLAQAGAEFAAISAVTPHLCMPELREASPLPLIDIIDTLVQELERRGINRLALLGTKYTMEQKLFGRLNGFDIIDLKEKEIDRVHGIYGAIAAEGGVPDADISYLKELCVDLCGNGAQTVVLAGTELSLVLHEGEEEFPLLDCARAHVASITARATA